VDSQLARFELVNQTTTLLDQDGLRFYAKSGATGLGEVLLKNFQGASSIVRFAVSQTGSAITYDLTGFSVGTVGKDGFDLIEERAALGGESYYYNGTSLSDCQNQLGGIQRNPLCWGADWDLSGVAIKYLNNNFNGGGCLVTPRHYVVSNHYQPRNKVGNTLQFLGTNGTLYTRTILAQTTGHSVAGQITNPVYDIGDIAMLLLSPPVAGEMDNVAVYPVAGNWLVKSNFESDNLDGTADYSFEWSYPVITTNQYRQLLFSTCNKLVSGWTVNYPLGVIDIDEVEVEQIAETIAYIKSGPAYQAYTGFQDNAIPGDSGSVWFLPLGDGTLVAFSHYTRATSGPLWNAEILNALILEVDSQVGISTGYTVTVAPDPTAP
jgi:hypothetical protein